MNEKDFNFAILNKLIEVAKEVFDKCTTIDEGEYTTSEIVKRKNRMGDIICIEFANDIPEYTIEHESFKCRIAGYSIFEALMRFEKLCRKSGKNVFVKGNSKEVIVKEKSVYYIGRLERDYGGEIIGDGDYKILKRKINIKVLHENVGVNSKGNVFYKYRDTWYMVSDMLPIGIIEAIEKDKNFIIDKIKKFDFTQKGEFVAIYKLLYEEIIKDESESIDNSVQFKEESNDQDFENKKDVSSYQLNKQNIFQTLKYSRNKNLYYLSNCLKRNECRVFIRGETAINTS